ncbi:MAG: arsenate reductase ArsC [Vulcanimicrobiota bacterium]
MIKILFLCTGNSCRSQMAEGLVNAKYENLKAWSAGTNPASINPNAIEVMKETGIDISNQTVNRPEDFENINFDYIITLCDHARDNCPVTDLPGERIHWGLADPACFKGSREETLEQFRKTRNEIEKRINKSFQLF